jgi:YgiT-type zinc finger domain-containing protein
MQCERCKGDMMEEELIVVGGIVRLKDVSAWHCDQCGRVEYRSHAASRMVEIETAR